MSSASRGRGRGRGAGRSSLSRQLSSDEDTSVPNAQIDDANENSDEETRPPSRSASRVPAASGSANPAVGASPRTSLQGRQSSTAPTGPAGTLLRRNVYTATAENKMKFKPQMVRRKVQTEESVKEEEVEPSLADPTAGRGRGRGRGRGARGEGHMQARGRGEIIMTASGAFSQGPSMNERGPSTNGRAFGASVMTDWSASSGGAGGSGSGGRKVTSTATLVDSDPEDYNDDNAHDRHGKKVETVDLFDIGKEGEMAPLVLPRDEKKWMEEEELRTENERAMRRMKGIKEDPKDDKKDVAKDGKDAKMDEAPAKTKLKMDPYEEEEMLAASLRGTPASTIGGTDSSRAQSISSTSAKPEEDVQRAAVDEAERTAAEPEEDAAVLGADDVKIVVKKEDVSPYFDLPKEEVSSERFYVFQFPRLFPQFYDPMLGPPGAPPPVKAEDGQDLKPAPGALNAALNGIGAGGGSSVPDEYSSAKHKVRSAYHESESEAWRDYEAGKWQGWGRNPGRDDREAMAGTGTEELAGRIGKIKIRKSGKTTMKLGGIEYEILPGAPASFLQEIAVLNSDAQDKPGMYVMGQMSKKFVIAPELTKLLTQDAMERRQRLVRMKEEEEERARRALKAKEEEAEVKIPPPLRKKPAAGTTGGTAKKPAPAKPRPKPAAAKSAAAASGAAKTASASK